MQNEETGSTKLSPRSLVDPSKYSSFAQSLGGADHDNYFTCVICFKVLSDPKECSQCQTAFCSDCIEKWTRERRSCPIKCQEARYCDLHRFVKNLMM